MQVEFNQPAGIGQRERRTYQFMVSKLRREGGEIPVFPVSANCDTCARVSETDNLLKSIVGEIAEDI
jgi:hypothetical protein